MRTLLDRIGGQSVCVIGDLYLDHYIFGSPQRVSREAPVMVLDEERHEYRLGGGAAPALALQALGCEVALGGVVGDDAEGERVIELLTEIGIDASHVVVDPNRPTTTKTRVVASGFLLFPQQLVRVDRQQRAPVDCDLLSNIGHAVAERRPDAVLISDYRSGVVTNGLVEDVTQAGKQSGALLTVDSQGELARFPGFDLIKCNQPEAEAVLGQQLGDRSEREQLLRSLRDKLDGACIVVTRGGAGASIVTGDGYDEVPAPNHSEVFDVTGAGDTVVAVMTAALLAGGDPVEAARLAQVAAGIVVRKWGNAQASRGEIERALAE